MGYAIVLADLQLMHPPASSNGSYMAGAIQSMSMKNKQGYADSEISDSQVFDALRYRIEVDQEGTRRYYNSDGRIHREDGPAVEYADGTKVWLINGLRHREDGPAVEIAGSTAIHTRLWYFHGQLLTKIKHGKMVRAEARKAEFDKRVAKHGF